jgi:hypothetical protein
MFASIRRYRLQRGSMEELARRVDEGFAEDIGRRPGFVAYEFIDCGDGEIMTLSVFREADQAEASRELAPRWTEANLQDLEFSRLAPLRGEILVSRAAQDMLEPGHARAAPPVRSHPARRPDASASRRSSSGTATAEGSRIVRARRRCGNEDGSGSTAPRWPAPPASPPSGGSSGGSRRLDSR